MANIFKNKAKLFLIIYAILAAVIIVFGMFFMTNYANIHVVIKTAGNGIEFSNLSSVQIQSTSVSNAFLYEYICDYSTISGVSKGEGYWETYAKVIYDFNNAINDFNNLLIAFGIVTLISVAVIFIFGNQSRRIYYKSNLYIGILAPVVVIVMGIVTMISLFGVLGSFNANINLFKLASVMLDPNMGNILFTKIADDSSAILAMADGVNSLTMIIALIVILVVIAYSVFIIIFTFKKYKNTEKERKEIIERASSEERVVA